MGTNGRTYFKELWELNEMINTCKVLAKGPGTQRTLNKWQLLPPSPFLPIVSASLFIPLPFGQIQTLQVQVKELCWACQKNTHSPEWWLFSAWKLKFDLDVSLTSEGAGKGESFGHVLPETDRQVTECADGKAETKTPIPAPGSLQGPQVAQQDVLGKVGHRRGMLRFEESSVPFPRHSWNSSGRWWPRRRATR